MMRASVLMLIAACGGKPADSPPSGSGSAKAGPGSNGIGPSGSDPAWVVVDRAFRNQRPAFPLLSKDGNTALVEIVTPIGQSGGSTYSIGAVTAGADAWSGGVDPDLVTLVDAKLVHLLLESETAVFDQESITKAARGVGDRILEGGFRPFDGVFDAIGIGDLVSAGPFRFKVTEEATTAITIAISEGTQQIATEQIQPLPMGRVGDVDCIALPVVKRAFSDAGRRRLLLHIGWNTGPDQCDTPDDKYRLFSPR